jgi:hypothetical protein
MTSTTAAVYRTRIMPMLTEGAVTIDTVFGGSAG